MLARGTISIRNGLAFSRSLDVQEDILFVLARVNQQRGQQAQSKQQLTKCFALLKKKGEIDRNLFHSWESWAEQVRDEIS